MVAVSTSVVGRFVSRPLGTPPEYPLGCPQRSGILPKGISRSPLRSVTVTLS
jgi:hypothetical protein